MLFNSSQKLIVRKIFKFLSGIFDHVGKQLDKKTKFNFKTYDVTRWITNSYNTHIAQYLKSKGNQLMKFGQFVEYNGRNIYLQKSYGK